MNETKKLLTHAAEVELIDALGALWAKDYLANNESAEVAEYVYDVTQGNGDMFVDDNRESQEDLWQSLHEAFFAAVAADPEVAALVEKMEADDVANRPSIDWFARLEHARAELAKAEEKRIKYPKDKGLVACVRNCKAFLRSEEARAADAGFDTDGTPSF